MNLDFNFFLFTVMLAFFAYIMTSLNNKMKAVTKLSSDLEVRRKDGGVGVVNKLCILIDGENMPNWVYDQVHSLASGMGEVAVSRVYADWGIQANSSWRPQIKKFGIEPISVVPAVTGKNATDMVLAIDAVELLKDDIADIFIFASSDTDFVPLYRRIRRQGKIVVVFGMPYTPQVVREHCNDFVEAVSPHTEVAHPAGSPQPSLNRTTPAVNADDNLDAFLKAYNQCRPDTGWAYVSEIANALDDMYPGGTRKVKGEHANLTKYIRSTGLFDSSMEQNRMRVRLKSLDTAETPDEPDEKKI